MGTSGNNFLHARGTETDKRKDFSGDYETDRRKQQMREETKMQGKEKHRKGIVQIRVGERREYEGSSRKSCRTQGMKSAGRSTGAE